MGGGRRYKKEIDKSRKKFQEDGEKKASKIGGDEKETMWKEEGLRTKWNKK